MSQRLSNSATFQALTGRVASLEGIIQSRVFAGQVNAPGFQSISGPGLGYSFLNPGNAANSGYLSFYNHLNARIGYIGFASDSGPIPYVSDNGQGHAFSGGPLTLGDANFGMTFSSSPLLSFDLNDGVRYNRGANLFQFLIGGTVRLEVGATSTTADLFQASSFAATIGTGAGAVRLTRSFSAGSTGILEFVKSDGSRNGYVGFNPDAGAMQYGSDTGAGHNFAGGPITLDDANIGIKKVGADPVFMCDSGDYLYFSRSANKFIFVIGGTNVASIDGAGNVKIAGTLTQGATV